MRADPSGVAHPQDDIQSFDQFGRRIEYLRSLFGAFCHDEDDVESRCMLTLSLWIGNHFILADHGTRSRARVLQLAMRRLEAQ